MTPVPNSDDHLMDVDPLRQPPVTTSRQVSLVADTIADSKAAMITPPSRLIGDRDQVTAVITSSMDAVPLSSLSTRSILGFTNSSSDGKNNTDDAVRQPASTSTVSSSTEMANYALPPPSQMSANRDTFNVIGTYTGSSNIVHPIAASQSTISPSTFSMTTHSTEDRSLQPTIATTGTKRKMSLNADPRFSPTAGSSQSNTPMSRRDSLPMLLRNKKMKATDCLLFAATLLEQDAVEALMAAGTTPSTTDNRSSPPNDRLSAMSHVMTSFVAPTVPSPPKKKTKPLKKMVCEKIERSLQKIALERKKQLEELAQELQQEQHEDEDCENKPKDADVLCGRGGKVNKHTGNIVYRKVVEYNKSYYQSVHKKHRILVSQSIVKAILNYGGRFMGQKGKEWTPICFKRAVQKTSQALRERSNTSDVVMLKGRSNTSDVVMQGFTVECNHRKQKIVVKAAETKK